MDINKFIKNVLYEHINDNKILKEHLFSELSLLIEKQIQIGSSLKRKLGNINKPFADKLLGFLTSNQIPDNVTIDSIDYTKDDNKTLTGFFKDKDGNIKRRKFKIGKLLNYLGISSNEFKGYEIQELISHLKKGTTNDFKVVEGEYILWAYHCDNYDEGETMGSCMRYESAQKYLDIYIQNPDNIKCLVLVNPANNKIRGRALLFHMDNDQIYMDRVYTTNDEYKYLFNQYAENNNYTTNVGRNDTVTLSNDGSYEYYPYLDTFMYYSPDDGVLSTVKIDDGYIKLQDTHGGYSDDGVYVEYGRYEDEYIHEDDAIYLSYRTPYTYIEGYAHVDDVVAIDNDVYLDEHVVSLYDGENAFKYDDIVEITHGAYEDEYARIDDVTTLNSNYYGEAYAHIDDVIDCDSEFYGDDSEYFLSEDVIETYNDKYIYHGDAVKLYPPHYGDNAAAHVDDCSHVKIKGYGEAYILDDDMDEFENEGLLESKKTKLRLLKSFF